MFDKFKEMFPLYANHNLKWFMNGRNSIRIQGVDIFCFGRQDIVFTINDKGNEMRLETFTNYMARIVKGDELTWKKRI